MKQKIVQESILLFDQKGFGSTSIQDIVDALNVTKGTFYYYFSSKEQLLMDIHLDYIEDLLNHQEKIMLKQSSYREKLQDIVYLLIKDIEVRGSEGKVFFREMRHLGEKHAEIIREKRNVFRENVELILREGMKQGDFREGLQAHMLSFAILGITNWSYQWYQPAGSVSPKELTNIYIDMILNGILPS
ncbi:TetR/AcrR family transcriptional regulator [Lysinibacillus sp. LZ02]|uniref:TetR/AcrR family transcriptional regulator n=1 Tax=Lysinibacillus sp. LZ02 TaxID=3420668 RepID=UPI003D364858